MTFKDKGIQYIILAVYTYYKFRQNTEHIIQYIKQIKD